MVDIEFQFPYPWNVTNLLGITPVSTNPIEHPAVFNPIPIRKMSPGWEEMSPPLSIQRFMTMGASQATCTSLMSQKKRTSRVLHQTSIDGT